MGQRLIITEAEKLTIQYKHGMDIVLLEESDKFSKEDILQKLNTTFDLGPKTKNSLNNILKNSFGKIDNKTIISIILPILISMNSCQTSGDGDCDSQTQIKLDGSMYEKYKEWDTNNDSVLDDYEKSNYGRDYAEKMVDSITLNVKDEFSKNSENNSGVNILSVKIVDADEYTNYKAIKLTYKNNTGKDISAISFAWYDLKDIFDEDVDAVLSPGGYDDDILRNGKTTSSTWDLSEKTVKSGKAYVSKIMFTDGTKWENKLK